MASENKVTWEKIKISGTHEAFVAKFHGREIGYIFRNGRTSSWVIKAGIGEVSQDVVMTYSKVEAKKMLETAPERLWK